MPDARVQVWDALRRLGIEIVPPTGSEGRAGCFKNGGDVVGHTKHLYMVRGYGGKSSRGMHLLYVSTKLQKIRTPLLFFLLVSIPKDSPPIEEWQLVGGL